MPHRSAGAEVYEVISSSSSSSLSLSSSSPSSSSLSSSSSSSSSAAALAIGIATVVSGLAYSFDDYATVDPELRFIVLQIAREEVRLP
jgi:hypothetical protein